MSAIGRNSSAESERKAGELLHSTDLLYLNTHYSQSSNLSADSIQSHRGGVLGRLVTKAKRKLHSIICHIFESYFESEREFNGHLIRHLNDTAKYVDARDMANFWELVRKIDYDVTKALDRIERINDEQMGAMRSQEQRVAEALRQSVGTLQEKVAEHGAQLTTLESVARGLEGIVARISDTSSSVVAAEEGSSEKQLADFSYLLLENRYRGSEAEIGERLRIYPAVFPKSEKPVLEIGSGRGELLELFGGAQIPAYGVDIDQAMVQTAAAKGVDARLGNGLAHLHSLENDSLNGVIAIQVVEHLTRAQLEDLFSSCRDKVAPGGRVVFETINPRSVLALSSNYFRDPTHIWPLHPDTLEYAMTLAGLKTVEVKYLSPVAKESELRDIPVEEYMSPRWVHAIDSINSNFEQLNHLLYGHQDYCIIAEVP